MKIARWIRVGYGTFGPLATDQRIRFNSSSGARARLRRKTKRSDESSRLQCWLTELAVFPIVANMKTETLQMSVPQELAEFMRQDVAEGQFANVNEYVRALIRQLRQARIEEEARFLEQAMTGAPAGEPPPDFYARIKELQRAIRQEKKARR